MILKLQPVFKNKVWGGNKLKNIYQYPCTDKTGEAWGISGHKNGPSVITNTVYKGQTLRELYETHKELFGHYHTDEFPILIKVIDAADDLSIQVHPGDDYAKQYENSLGKTECWYVLDAEENTDIIIGHKAQTKDEFNSYIQLNEFENVLNKFPINKGDQFYIYAGTIHAICKGTLILEIQQSSDVTYRIYDYNRLSDGKLRELHIDKAMDVIKFPDQELSKEKPTNLFDFNIYEHLNQSDHQADVYGDYIFVLEGSGKINDIEIKKGDFLMVSSKDNYQIIGEMKFVKAVIK
jgi:mannose-6-phosphate isomerase